MAIRFSYDTGTFEIGRYRGAPIELSPLFFLSAMALALPFWRSFDLRGLALTVMFLAIFFASILIHELAHAPVATRCRVRVARIELNVLGGLVHFWGLPRTMRQDFSSRRPARCRILCSGLRRLRCFGRCRRSS